MKYIAVILIMPLVFIVGYVLPGFVEVIPRAPDSNALFFARVLFGILLATATLIALARSLKFSRRQVAISITLSLASTCLASGIIIYYLLSTVGGM